MSIHQKIRDFRRAKGWTEQQFADACDVSRSTIRLWELDGGTAPNRKKQPDVARVMGITVAELVADDSVRTKTFEAQAKCLVLRAAHDTFGKGTQCHIVVSGSGTPHAARTVDLLSTVGTLYATESAEDMRNYITHIAKAARNPVMPVRQ